MCEELRPPLLFFRQMYWKEKLFNVWVLFPVFFCTWDGLHDIPRLYNIQIPVISLHTFQYYLIKHQSIKLSSLRDIPNDPPKTFALIKGCHYFCALLQGIVFYCQMQLFVKAGSDIINIFAEVLDFPQLVIPLCFLPLDHMLSFFGFRSFHVKEESCF